MKDSKISPYAKLVFADSLFEIGKYTEAFEVYEQLLKEDSHYTPKMLLRMAYIKEGLDDYAQALYYLNLYYHYQADDKVLTKMADLAEKKKLSGYRFSDYDFLLSLLQRHRIYVVISFFSVSILLTGYMFLLQRRKKRPPLFPLTISNLVLLATFFYILNYVKSPEFAIVKQDHVYAMSAPSAGAEVVKIFKKGDRVEVVGKHDIWHEIKSETDIGFIRQHHLLVVK
ncbi:MAG: SH3 domain-containing protein [Flammeovirgaceae bacterium]|nr:SH3 domain-containing protein [Flammeovirgaceae bacterium]MDW8288394.1 SH3 domain-containing protein [Flammeovirgaceae bacterium]